MKGEDINNGKKKKRKIKNERAEKEGGQRISKRKFRREKYTQVHRYNKHAAGERSVQARVDVTLTCVDLYLDGPVTLAAARRFS